MPVLKIKTYIDRKQWELKAPSLSKIVTQAIESPHLQLAASNSFHQMGANYWVVYNNQPLEQTTVILKGQPTCSFSANEVKIFLLYPNHEVYLSAGKDSDVLRVFLIAALFVSGANISFSIRLVEYQALSEAIQSAMKWLEINTSEKFNVCVNICPGCGCYDVSLQCIDSVCESGLL